MNRRRVALVAVGVLVLGLVAVGTLVPGNVLGLVYSDSAAFTAQPAEPTDEALENTEFGLAEEDELVVEESFEALGQTRTVVVTNHLRTYEKSIAVQDEEFDAAVFAVLTTPAVEIAGTAYNPVADMTHEELLAEFQSELEGGYGDLDSAEFEKVDERETVSLDREITVSRFATDVVVDGRETTVYVHVTTIESNDDVVVAVGAHPAPFSQERVHIFELLRSLEHPAE